eukprot:gene110-161_t
MVGGAGWPHCTASRSCSGATLDPSPTVSTAHAGYTAETPARAVSPSRLNAANAAIMEAEARRLALMELGDRIRDMDEPGDIAYAASEMLGRRLAVDRAGYGLVDTAAETI